MLTDYKDIRDRIPEEPKWFDEHGVPRYCDFSPREISNVYAREAALYRIACQACGHFFDVADSSGGEKLAEAIRAKTLHYGDPPNIGCCAAGATMNSEPQRVLEYWRRNKSTDFDWVRDPSFEVEVSDAG